MAKCECCGKGVTFGIKVSHSHRRALAKLPALSKLMHVAGHFVEWPAFLL